MDIKQARRLITKRLEDAIDELHSLRVDIETFEEGDSWLAEGLEVVLENISKLAVIADGGDLDNLVIDDAETTDDDYTTDDDDVGLEDADEDEDLDTVAAELDFGGGDDEPFDE